MYSPFVDGFIVYTPEGMYTVILNYFELFLSDEGGKVFDLDGIVLAIDVEIVDDVGFVR